MPQRVVIREWSPPKEPMMIANLVETTEGQDEIGKRHVS